jgi:hypothetical protein
MSLIMMQSDKVFLWVRLPQYLRVVGHRRPYTPMDAHDHAHNWKQAKTPHWQCKRGVF